MLGRRLQGLSLFSTLRQIFWWTEESRAGGNCQKDHVNGLEYKVSSRYLQQRILFFKPIEHRALFVFNKLTDTTTCSTSSHHHIKKMKFSPSLISSLLLLGTTITVNAYPVLSSSDRDLSPALIKRDYGCPSDPPCNSHCTDTGFTGGYCSVKDGTTHKCLCYGG